jgi:UDP:flavonoid glycosyltransferase YjiC (YdhE family)
MRPNVVAAVKAYRELAAEAGMSATEMALRLLLKLDHKPGYCIDFHYVVMPLHLFSVNYK